jgi:hypothetical protein
VAGGLAFIVLLGAVESLAAGEVHAPGGWPLLGAAAVVGAGVIVGTVGLALAAGVVDGVVIAEGETRTRAIDVDADTMLWESPRARACAVTFDSRRGGTPSAPTRG